MRILGLSRMPMYPQKHLEVQNRMLTVSMLQEQEFDSQQRLKIYSDIIRDVVAVSKLYKRKSRKSRNSAIQAPNSRKKKIRESHIIVKKADEQGYASDNSSDFEEEEEEEQAKQMKPEIVIQADQTNIRDILKDAGILKEQQSQVDRSVIRFSSRSSFKSYSENNNIESDNQFCNYDVIQSMIVRIRKGLYRGGKEVFLDINRDCLIILQSFLRGKVEDMISTSIDVYILRSYRK